MKMENWFNGLDGDLNVIEQFGMLTLWFATNGGAAETNFGP